jgi:hypothetical protein
MLLDLFYSLEMILYYYLFAGDLITLNKNVNRSKGGLILLVQRLTHLDNFFASMPDAFISGFTFANRVETKHLAVLVHHGFE